VDVVPRVHPSAPMEPAAKSLAEQGAFVNHFEVANSREEFLIAVGQVLPGDTEAKLTLRLVTTPPYAHALWQVLGESLNRYQAVYGAIPPLEG